MRKLRRSSRHVAAAGVQLRTCVYVGRRPRAAAAAARRVFIIYGARARLRRRLVKIDSFVPVGRATHPRASISVSARVE